MNKIICLVLFVGIFASSCGENPRKEPESYKRLAFQDFERLQIDRSPDWQPALPLDEGPYTEGGDYFVSQGITAPEALRGTYGIDENVQVEIYTRDKLPLIFDYIDVINDPNDSSNRVFKISTKSHTDAVILRSVKPLPANYTLSFKIGHANYGNNSELNGYNEGDESGEPWMDISAVRHNGFYWLAILDTEPKPHNNIWMHHHRKFVIDSWNRKKFDKTINVIALNGNSDTRERFGKQFYSFVGTEFSNLQDKPVDYYLDNEWYEVRFTRTSETYQFSITGNFKNRGRGTISGEINIKERCVYHFNQSSEEMSANCADNGIVDVKSGVYSNWPINSSYPEYFIIGEPHINFYEGSVLVDDIRLEFN